MKRTELGEIEAEIHRRLDLAKPGEKINRERLAMVVGQECGSITLRVLQIIPLVLEGRLDFHIVKGPRGGTFKK